MSAKEATARIKINKLLEAAGWHFFPEDNAPANIRLESNATIKSSDLDALGENFEKTSKGFIDFLLLDAKGLVQRLGPTRSESSRAIRPSTTTLWASFPTQTGFCLTFCTLSRTSGQRWLVGR